VHVIHYAVPRPIATLENMLLTVFLILPIMSMLSTLSKSTARTFTRTAVSRAPAVFARGEHTLPKLSYGYDVSSHTVSFSIRG
jgi:hypothetical protein